MRTKKTQIIGSVMLAGLTLIMSGCQQQAAQNQTQTLTLPAVTGTINEAVTFIGNVASSQSSSLSWRTSGVIESVEVELGDKVTEGQIIASLDKDTVPSSVLASEVTLLDAKQELEDLLVSETAKAQSYSTLADKELALEKAEDYQESLKYPKGNQSDIEYWASQMEITQGFYDDALEEYSAVSMWQDIDDDFYQLQEDKYSVVLSTLNNYAEAYNNYLYYRENSTDNEKEQAAADIDVAEAEYENALRDFRTYAVYPRTQDVSRAESTVDKAQDTYNQRSIVSNINGVVTVLSARVGDYVERGKAAFQLDNTDRLFIPIDVSEIDIVKIQDGQKAQIALDANAGVIYDGVVTTVSDYGVEEGSRTTFTTMVEFTQPDDNVKLGMTAEVDIIQQEHDGVLLIPVNAIITDGETSYVQVMRDDVPTRVDVTLGLSNDTIAEVTGGELVEGDLIAVPSIDENLLNDLGLDMSYMRQTMTMPEGMGMPAGMEGEMGRPGVEGMPVDGTQMPQGEAGQTGAQSETSENSERPQINIGRE